MVVVLFAADISTSCLLTLLSLFYDLFTVCSHTSAQCFLAACADASVSEHRLILAALSFTSLDLG